MIILTLMYIKIKKRCLFVLIAYPVSNLLLIYMFVALFLLLFLILFTTFSQFLVRVRISETSLLVPCQYMWSYIFDYFIAFLLRFFSSTHKSIRNETYYYRLHCTNWVVSVFHFFLIFYIIGLYTSVRYAQTVISSSWFCMKIIFRFALLSISLFNITVKEIWIWIYVYLFTHSEFICSKIVSFMWILF